MCEIVRAMVANGKFSTVTDNVLNIPLEITDYIDCPGNEGLFNKFITFITFFAFSFKFLF